jgi:hypothetical protein
MDYAQVFHPLYGYSMCYGPYADPGLPGLDAVAHGTLVTCRVCGRLGVIPEEGHELEFLPPGTERGPAGGFTCRPPSD